MNPSTKFHRPPHRAPFVLVRGASLALLAAALAACGAMPGTATPGAAAAGPSALARLQPTRGSGVTGTVSFTQQGDRVAVVARVGGLAPNREHGFHVHEKGDCSSPDGTSAGDHFNPGGQPHGPQNAPHHGGDLPALKADAAGNASAGFTIAGSVLGAGGADVMGKAVIVHAQPDDYATQPSGNSGPRLACGVIETPTGTDPSGKPVQVPKQM